MFRIAQASVVAAAVLLSLSQTALAAKAGADKDRAHAEAFSSQLKLQKTYHEVGSAGGLAIPASTITDYGSTQAVSCTSSTGCYVLVEAEAQIAPTASESSTAICVRVNGVSTDGCPFLTRSSTTGFTSFNHRGGVSVPLGNHTVSTAIYVGVAASLYNYNTTVQLYKK
ncbi:MAG: hypothetical protein U1F53_10885 [Burkholderiaceae bacterium]